MRWQLFAWQKKFGEIDIRRQSDKINFVIEINLVFPNDAILQLKLHHLKPVDVTHPNRI